MRRAIPPDPSAALRALAQQVDRLRADVDALAQLRGDLATVRQDLAAHGRALAELSRLVSPAEGAPAVAAGLSAGDSLGQEEIVPDWLTVADPYLAVSWLADLSAWVPRVWLRYPGSGMPSCWPWHPAIVAELLVSRHAWALAVLPGQTVMALAQWHDRWRPTATLRVTKALTGCERGGGCHVNPAGRHFRYDPAFLDELAVWWATSEHPDLDAAPGLLPEAGQHPRGPVKSPGLPRARDVAS